MSDMQHELQMIRERNRRVEADKAWETSWTRRLFIAAVTYCIAVLFLWSIDVALPGWNALVPTGGYLLSTLSLASVKRRWLQRYAERSTP